MTIRELVHEQVTVGGETQTTVRVWHGDRGGVGVTVTVRCLPGYSWWTCPDAGTLRHLVDKALDGTGYRRTGRRDELTPTPPATWMFRYTTQEVPQ